MQKTNQAAQDDLCQRRDDLALHDEEEMALTIDSCRWSGARWWFGELSGHAGAGATADVS